ncbi:hypothetical protein MYX64_07480 [Nitrospinae bacterium AH_259_B05_G02_I21]|nr:hypothetical protein [Nitrospinae bacterium AH_259_B05_G02_I21]MDA2932439.1 hypothetical protein [Nitrospinae bacterium AH-259-F20]
MTNRSKDQEISTVTLDDIAQCLCDELGIDIDQNSYRELIDLIETSFKIYWSLRTGKGVKFPLFGGIEALDNAISSLEKVRLVYIVVPDYDLAGLIELYEKYLSGEDTDFIFDGSGGQKTRKRKIKSVTDALSKIKKNLLSVVESTNPIAIVGLENAEGWLTWILFKYLRSAFPGHALHNTQIDKTVYLLLKLHGVQQKESKNPKSMIRQRRIRFFEEIEPHLPPPE